MRNEEEKIIKEGTIKWVGNQSVKKWLLIKSGNGDKR